jgi:hypothetical protein
MGGKSGGGGGAAPSSGNMPSWAKKAHKDLLARANTESQSPYQGYKGDQVADQNALTGQGIQATQALSSGTNAKMETGYNSTGAAMDAAKSARDVSLGSFATFGGDQASKYMSPYQQAVTDVVKRKANEDFARANIDRNSTAVSRGAFGGSRSAIIQSEADKNQAINLSDMQTKGLQDSWLNAMNQFNADRKADTDVQTTNQKNDQFKAEQLLSGANQQAKIGSDIYDNQAANADKIYEQGLREEGRTQAEIDAAMADFYAQRDHSKNEMNWYSGIMSGNPVSYTNYSGEGRSNASNLLGLGAAAIGASGNSAK